MRNIRWCLIALSSLAVPSVHAAIRCVTPSGDVIFTDVQCPLGSRPAGRAVYDPEPATGLRAGERELLERIEARESDERAAKRYSRERDARHHVSYGDRLKIRELEMEKRALNKSLNRGSKSYGEAKTIRSSIRGIDRQIEQLRSPKW